MYSATIPHILHWMKAIKYHCRLILYQYSVSKPVKVCRFWVLAEYNIKKSNIGDWKVSSAESERSYAPLYLIISTSSNISK